MALFKVKFDAWWEIEADNEEDAASIAWDNLNSGDYHPDVEEIEKPTRRQRTFDQKRRAVRNRLTKYNGKLGADSPELQAVERFLWEHRSDD